VGIEAFSAAYSAPAACTIGWGITTDLQGLTSIPHHALGGMSTQDYMEPITAASNSLLGA